MLAET
jgi:hypothetical protein